MLSNRSDDSVSLVDVETGEVLCTYTPGNPADAPELVRALGNIKSRLAALMQTKRSVEHALLEIYPHGVRTPDCKIEVEVNLTRDDAKRLVAAGFGSCIGLTESVRYRLLKTEVKKLESLAPDSFEELMGLLANCTRSIRVAPDTDSVTLDMEAQ